MTKHVIFVRLSVLGAQAVLALVTQLSGTLMVLGRSATNVDLVRREVLLVKDHDLLAVCYHAVLS